MILHEIFYKKYESVMNREQVLKYYVDVNIDGTITN